MRPRSWSLIVVTVAASLFEGAATAAEAPEASSSPPRLELSVSRTPPPTSPLPSPQVLQKDADEAIAAIQERRRAEEVAREAVRGWERQPNLQRDVVQGIQSIGIRDALRRR